MQSANHWLEVDWTGIIWPTHSPLEILVRGTLIYFILFVILRFFLKRQAGGIGISDFLVIVLIADAAQNGMSADYRSITEGALLVLTIVFWDYAVDWLGYNVPAFERLIHPRPILLVKDGTALSSHLSQEKITMDELMSYLRLHGIEDLSQVRRSFIEGDGRISVIRQKKSSTDEGSGEDERGGRRGASQ
jgi:uncharacterized membrane protein YcaP (DUF421 family)